MLDTTGTLQSSAGFSQITSLTLVNNRFVNDLAGLFHLQATAGQRIDGTVSGKNCVFLGNVASGVVGGGGGLEQWKGCTMIGNTWGQGNSFSAVIARPMTAYAWNLMVIGPSGPADFAVTSPVVLNTYWIGNTAGSWHMLEDNQVSMNQTLDGAIFENVNPANNEGHIYSALASGASTRAMRNSLSLPGPSGVTAGTGLMTATAGITAPTAIMEHNGWFGSAYWAWGGFLDHSGSGLFPANQEYLYYRSNNHWATSGTTNFALGDGLGSPSLAPSNNFNVAGIANNNISGGSTAATYGVGVSTNCSPSTSLGTHYDICTASGTPGLHDKAVDPKSLDIGRNAFQWAARVKGQAATAAGLLAAMTQCQDAWYCVEQLWSWVRQGAQPTNMALKGAAHDGKIVGVSGTFGSGYTGSCGVTFTAQDSGDLGTGATASCALAGGVPAVKITSGGSYYRAATPATATITCGGCTPTVAASLNAVVAPSDIGPVQMTSFGRVD